MNLCCKVSEETLPPPHQQQATKNSQIGKRSEEKERNEALENLVVSFKDLINFRLFYLSIHSLLEYSATIDQ